MHTLQVFYGIAGQDFQTIDVNKYQTRETVYGLEKETQYHFQVAAFKIVGVGHHLIGIRSQTVVAGKGIRK